MTSDELFESRARSQSIIGGALLILVAAVALWAMRRLDGGTLRMIGPGGLPRAMAVGIGTLGLIVLAGGLLKDRRDAIQPFAIRGTVVVLASIMLFAMTIRPFALGAVSTPGLGLLGAGPLAIMVAGFAERERNWLDLGILAAGLTAFCMILFGYLLNLPIPAFPIGLLAVFPGWQHHHVLLAVSGGLVILAVGLWLVRRKAGAIR